MLPQHKPKPKAAQGDTGTITAGFAFQGVPLKPFSVHHREAYYRLTANVITNLERSKALVFMLTHLDGRQACAIRSDADFVEVFFQAGEWYETIRNGFTGADKQKCDSELMEVAKAVLEDVEKAESVTPKTSGGESKNA